MANRQFDGSGAAGSDLSEMSLLGAVSAFSARAAVADGPLAALADGLTSELAPLVDRDLYLPREKALLSRAGGRCARHGATLEFDPFSPHRHRCPVCGETYAGMVHDRFWVFWYQLWLVERAVHAALLASLRGDAKLRSVAERIVEGYCAEYLLYPNRDNVLGPTRLFFSTYLESIWLLNLCIAVDLLEGASPDLASLGTRARERIIEPAASIIAEYDEGASNRQVWNDAALIAANRLLGRGERIDDALFGRSGVFYHLQNNLLPDGTWYEGENYHLFAHRGLWYGITMAEAMGAELPHDLLARFQEGFATPFLTALPDFTLPSRRDSQYAISLRQPRFAELAELGLARQPGDGDARLRSVLYRLYHDDIARGDTGRSRTTADVERNLPGTSLSRADLGWRSLLFARPTLPTLEPEPLGTVLLESQGLAVFRRADERIYVALDYGASGGGHGHPDRLNMLLSDGPVRWLDDMGTGSYVDPSLHWYRSTLAHNAPLFNGYEQQRVDGVLLAFDEREEIGWISARARPLGPGVSASRTLVVMSDYVLDELVWSADRPVFMDLPIHIDPLSVTIRRRPTEEETSVWVDNSLDDTLEVLHDVASAWVRAHKVVRLLAHEGGRTLRGHVVSSHGAQLFRAMAPGPPGSGSRSMLLLRVASMGERGFVRTVWSWNDAVEDVEEVPGRGTLVRSRTGRTDRHHRSGRGWMVERTAGSTQQSIQLAGVARHSSPSSRPSPAPSPPTHTLRIGERLAFDLGRDHYRRSEETWEAAGQPTARVEVLPGPNELIVDVTVRKTGPLSFVPAGAVNRYDNESPDINGDGVQLYLRDKNSATAWILIPTDGGLEPAPVRARVIEGSNSPWDLHAVAHRTIDGYAMRIRVNAPLGARAGGEFAMGVIVNEKPPDRERRRGQLVLGGGPGFVYLRGDREDPNSLSRFIVVP